MEEVDHLIEALNPRGHREGSLKEALLQERDRLQLVMQSCNQNKYSHTGNTGHVWPPGLVPVGRVYWSTAQLSRGGVTSVVMMSSLGPSMLADPAASSPQTSSF